jgi:cell division protein FtsW
VFTPQPEERGEPRVRETTAQFPIPAFDPWLFLAVFVLTVGGLLILFSASYAIGIEKHESAGYFVLRQATWAGLGFIGLYLMSCFDLRMMRSQWFWIYAVVMAMLAAVSFTPLGVAHEHVRRWLKLPFLPPFQPSELAKVALIFVLAHHLSRAAKNLYFSWWTWGGVAAIALPIIVLIHVESHLSAVLILLLTTLMIVHLAGAHRRQTAVVLCGLLLTGGIVVGCGAVRSYQHERIAQFINGKSDPRGKKYQIEQSLTALKEGKLWGKGFCQSQRKLFFLPASHTDFIFSVLGEEFGLLGTLLTLFIYGFLIHRCYTIAYQASDPFAALICAGMGTLVALQVVINVGVATYVLPTTGMPLPFISSGGSALFCTLLGMGLVLNVSRMPAQVTWNYNDATATRGRGNGRAHLSSTRAR